MTTEQLLRRYEDGPALLKTALEKVPADAWQWRPAPGKWSVHEIVCHCADSETNSAMRIRYLIGENEPVIQGYDQDRWASTFNYHGMPADLCLRQIESVRSWTAALLRQLPESAWQRSGTHSEMPGERYTAIKWLEIYAEHLEVHARQVDRTLAAWRSR